MARKSNYKRVADAASKVEVVSKGVKNTANELDSKFGNDGHRATRTARTRDVIVRERDSALPDLGARLFVDPLDGEKAVFACNIELEIGNPLTNSLGDSYIRDYLYPAYENAIIQGVKYDTSAVLSETKFREYHARIMHALSVYYFVSYQKAYVSNPNIVSKSLSVRDVNVYGPGVEESLKVMKNRLQQYHISPNLVKLMDWLFQIRTTGRTPNADLLQFCSDSSLLAAETDDTVSTVLRTAIANLTSDDNKVSSLIGKIQDGWKINVQHYTEMNGNPEIDFNWMNVWVNFGIERPSPINNLPYNSMDYMLFNDNPNSMCVALSTIYDSINLIWDPGLITPKSVTTETNVNIINDGLGTYSELGRNSERLLSAYRQYDYEQGSTSIDAVTAFPESLCVKSNAIDAKPDVQSVLKYLYNLEAIQTSGLTSMKHLVNR